MKFGHHGKFKRLQLRFWKEVTIHLLKRINSINRTVKLFNSVLAAVLFVASLFSVLGAIYCVGFSVPEETVNNVLRVLYTTNYLFFIRIITRKLWRQINSEKFVPKKVRSTEWIVAVLLFIAILPGIVSSVSGFWGLVINYIGSYFRIPLAILVSIAFLLKRINLLMNHKTNPSLILANSFLLLILLGTGFFLLPHSAVVPIKLLDAVFLATSAVCVTGLTPLDIASTLTVVGKIGLMILIQIGGLGFMTITNFFGLFFSGNTSLYSHLFVKNILSSDSMNSLGKTLLYIFLFTFVIELSGALIIWLNITGKLDMTLTEELGFAIFHAISAFCNAGFSTLPHGLNDPRLLDLNLFYSIIAVLVILGGIGFPILSNFSKIIAYHIRRFVYRIVCGKHSGERFTHLLNLNTRIVLVTSIVLWVAGAFFIALFEWNNAFKGMDVTQKIIQSFFCSVSPRTAGFNSVSLAYLTTPAIIMTMLLMWIGGGSQSTAGGIKVNVFATAMLNVYAVIRGRSRIQVFGREIPQNSLSQATSVILISSIILAISIITLTALEPMQSAVDLAFEAVSALGTVGLSMNLTSSLHTPAKMIIILLMFVGRVGMITILFGLVKKVRFTNLKYPEEQIIIN